MKGVVVAETRGRAVAFPAALTLLIGMVLGFLLAKLGAFTRYPVETVLVVVLVGSVLVLGWACREMLRELVPFHRRRAAEPEPGPESVPAAPPKLVLHREPNGVRR
ncbi:hypothetical protein GCM10022222_69290 [Amycolatopsis ultiminotia]|uniref:Uncharacterized protein n=1 Tax=Amycolatopsis ultiminotia TaxID=543629 RepID=A0ABP6Y3Q3_9PSEU